MGMFSIIGPFLMVYYICIFDDMLELKADLELSFFLTCIYTICMHSFVYKTVTKEVLIYSAIAILCAAFATLLGLKVYEKMDKNKISTAMYILLPLMAIMLIVNAYR